MRDEAERGGEHVTQFSIERASTAFRGGEKRGQGIYREDILNHLVDALQAALYTVYA